MHVLRLLAALSLLPATALAQEPATPAAPRAPEPLPPTFARELGPLPVVDVATAGGVRGKVEAVGPVQVAAGEEGSERLTIPLGAQQPVLCSVSRSRVDAGASTGALVESVAKSLEILSARPVEISGDGGIVVVFTEVLYRQHTAKGAVEGQFKIAVHPHPTHSLVCYHDEPGYSATFRRLVKGLAASLSSAAADDRAQARFAEVMTVEAGGAPVGYVEREIWEKEKGARYAITYEAMLLPRSPTALSAIDEFTAEQSDAAGLVTGVQAVHALDGKLDVEVSLRPGAAARTFAYSGQRAGKALTGTFRAREGLASELWFAKQLTAAGRPALTLAHDIYSARADPAGPTRLAYARDPKAPARVALTVGPMTVRGELDEAGLIRSYDVPGPPALVLRRIWSRGTP